MVALRRTKKLERHLPVQEIGDPSDTALGDWYANRLVIERQPLVLLVSARSLLPILVWARDVETLPMRLPELVRGRLTRLGVASKWIEMEIEAMNPVRVGKTVDRAVLGIMVDFAKSLPYHGTADVRKPEGLWELETWLEETPCYVSRRFEDTIFPDQATPNLLAARWQ